MASNAPSVRSQQALAVYVEPLAAGRRVAVFGDSSLGLGNRIASLGARAVCVWDPDAQRALREDQHAPPGVIVRALADGLAERNGAFDLAVVVDLELFDDAEALLDLVRRLVGDGGVALVAATNREGTAESSAFDYYELFDLVAREFDDVTMIAQLPFYGVALAELGEQAGDEAPSVSVDTQLAGADRTPEAFVALASQRGVRLDPYAIVELSGPASTIEDVEEAEGPRVALAETQLRAEALEAQVDELRARLVEAERVLRANQRIEELLHDRSSRVVELESILEERTRQLTQLADHLERERAGAEAGQIATAQLEAFALRAGRAERALAESEPELVRLGEAQGVEIARLEEGLRERGQAVRVLEVEVARRERMVRELVDTIEASAHTGAGAPTSAADESHERDALVEENAQLKDKLDALALELARREGEAQASAWSITELERRLETAAQATPPHDTGQVEPDPVPGSATQTITEPPVDPRLAAALDELDVLRRALAQEHEQRLRAESGERQPEARAEAQRQD